MFVGSFLPSMESLPSVAWNIGSWRFLDERTCSQLFIEYMLTHRWLLMDLKMSVWCCSTLLFPVWWVDEYLVCYFEWTSDWGFISFYYRRSLVLYEDHSLNLICLKCLRDRNQTNVCLTSWYNPMCKERIKTLKNSFNAVLIGARINCSEPSYSHHSKYTQIF